MVMSRILGPNGEPVELDDLAEPQTSHVAWLHHEIQGHPTRGLTPSRLASILDGAENGDLVAQFELYDDMEEKDGHIFAEMSKRRRALLGLEWDILPPRNATAREKADAAALKDMLEEIDDFESILFDTTDAIGKGFACQEIAWARDSATWLPQQIVHRPQTWFQLCREQRGQQIRLRDSTPNGAILNPFGWMVHTHRAKSGYLERAGLFRVLVWPYLFKSYSLGDLAEFLEIYGLPVRIGKYPSNASEKDKQTLLRALVSIGHKAAGIIPEGMLIDFKDAATGEPDAFELMIDWCERTVSKVILGSTLTSQADRGSNTHALGNVHNDVRVDLRDSDASQVARTLSRDLVYPIAALNGYAPNGLRRAPQFRFAIKKTEDLGVFATSLPPLVALGMQIPTQWAHQKLDIPQAQGNEPVLAAATSAGKLPVVATATARRIAALTAQPPDYVDALIDALMTRSRGASEAWVTRIRSEIEAAKDFDDVLARLSTLLQELPLDELAQIVAGASAAAERAGRIDAVEDRA
jgi:phage gp29-like protein